MFARVAYLPYTVLLSLGDSGRQKVFGENVLAILHLVLHGSKHGID